MLFNSYTFILLFLPLAIVGNRLLCNKPQVRTLLLIGMSLWFYGANDFSSLAILLSAIVVNHLILQQMHTKTDAKTRKILLILALIFNLGLLGVFKYTDFLFTNINTLCNLSLPALGLPLPLGISFFTFQQVACLVDAYRGEGERYRFSEYALFVSFFPYVISGPIAFHSEIIPQLRDTAHKTTDWDKFARGLTRFCIGLGKKVLLADTLAGVVTNGYSQLWGINSTMAALTMFAYTFQLYFDFSGYCDMASGVALMLGFELPQNFDSPYKATSISQFWKGWHMTMTRFFTRYLYIPLGGSRKGTLRTYANTLIIFLVSGLWHGANWTFIVWGGMHGCAMVVEKWWRTHVKWRMPKFVGWLLTFSFVNVAWVFFRAASVREGITFLRQLLFGGIGGVNYQFVESVLTTEIVALNKLLWIPSTTLGIWVLSLLLILCLLICVIPQNIIRRTCPNFTPSRALLVGCSILLLWAVVSFTGVSTFLYVNF